MSGRHHHHRRLLSAENETVSKSGGLLWQKEVIMDKSLEKMAWE